MAVKVEPGRDPEMAARTRRLNLVFAASSLLLLLALSWMVWADYDREWKRYQAGFAAFERKLTEAQIKEAEQKIGPDKVKAIRDAVAQAERDVAARRGEVAEARAEVERLKNGEEYRADQDYKFTKAEIDVARYEWEEAAKHGSASAARKKAVLDAKEKRWGELRLALDDVMTRRQAAEARLAELEKARREAEEQQKTALGELTRLEARLAKLQQGVVGFLRNLPILDLANPSLKINQIMPASLNDDVIFTQTPKVDRCTTCHLGIDQKGYESAPQPYTSHPEIDVFLRGSHPIERIGCTACHLGRGRATSFVNAVHTPASKEQEKAWGEYSGTHEYERWHLWDLPMLAKGHTQSQCLKCHQGVVEVPQADKLNTGIFLMERYGCFGCHKIKGWEGLRKVGPDLTKIAGKTDAEWIFRWVKEPRAFRPTRMPQIWGVRTPDQETPAMQARNDTELNAVVAYVMAKSARPSFPEPPRGNLESGRRLFESVGCLGCHRIGDDRRGIDVAAPGGQPAAGFDAAAFRTHGPNLDGSGSKLDAGWLYAWIRDPRGLWHETRMPSLRLTEQEAADLTAYLMSLKNESFASIPRPALDAALRDEIIRREFLEQQFTVAEAKRRLDAMGDEQRTLFLGEKMIARYGCFGCHVIGGFEKASPIGTELTEQGSKLVERLDFGYLEGEIPHTLPAWLEQKLLEPRSFDRDKPSKKPEELLRMPKFHLSEPEAEAIVTAVLSLTKEQVPLAAQRRLSADERYVEAGRRLVRSYNCQGCHRVGAKGGSIQAVIEDQLKAQGVETLRAQALSPPILYNERSRIGEGARVHTDWLHGFLKDPQDKIRPWIEVRMPSFGFGEEEVNAITRYFAAQDGVAYPYEPKPAVAAATVATGKLLFEKWQCVRCHVVAGRLPSQDDPANMAPDLALVPRRLRAEWLTQWLAEPSRIMPGTRMPANFPSDPNENAFPEILGGDQKKQIEAVRAYLLTLGGGGGARAN
jgi:cytochrome c2